MHVHGGGGEEGVGQRRQRELQRAEERHGRGARLLGRVLERLAQQQLDLLLDLLGTSTIGQQAAGVERVHERLRVLDAAVAHDVVLGVGVEGIGDDRQQLDAARMGGNVAQRGVGRLRDGNLGDVRELEQVREELLGVRLEGAAHGGRRGADGGAQALDDGRAQVAQLLEERVAQSQHALVEELELRRLAELACKDAQSLQRGITALPVLVDLAQRVRHVVKLVENLRLAQQRGADRRGRTTRHVMTMTMTHRQRERGAARQEEEGTNERDRRASE